MSYDELLARLATDLPGVLPGFVQSSIGGSSGSVPVPSSGANLVWDPASMLFVPAQPPDAPKAPWGAVSGPTNASFPTSSATDITWSGLNGSNGMNVTASLFTVPTAGIYHVGGIVTPQPLSTTTSGYLQLLIGVNNGSGFGFVNNGSNTFPLPVTGTISYPSVTNNFLVSMAAGGQIKFQLQVAGISPASVAPNGGQAFVYKVSN